ncbi:glycosyltransferase family 39 protein [Malonomonas rubra]|uniref:ArnT family glycosyltransferase n=1 Tax=Malonomonas rubra TaxID=57040 RepID=UPI0026ECB321|nr:glycosyltransferase family 39 protein [Malonomonas rubra]
MNHQVISNDGPRYINQTLQFIDGEFVAAFKRDSLFLYPLLIAAFAKAGLDPVLTGELISAISSVLVLCPLYLLFKRIGTPTSAFWSCLVFAVMPVFNKFSVTVMRDPFFLFVVAWLVYLLWYAFERLYPVCFLLCSFLTMLLMTIRLEGILFLPIGLLLLLVTLVRSPAERIRTLTCAGFYLAPLLLILVAAGWYFAASAGESFRAAQVGNFVSGVAERGIFFHHPAVDASLDAAQAVTGPMPENDFVQIVRENVAIIYLIGMLRLLIANIWWPFFLVGMIGLVCSVEKKWGRTFLAVTIFTYLLMAYLHNLHLNFLDERYLYIPTMFFCFWIGLGVECLVEMAGSLTRKRVVCGVVSVLLIFSAVQSVKAMTPKEGLSSMEAGQWLAAQPSLQGLSLLANGEKIPFYGGRGDDFIRAEFARDFRREVSLHQPELISIETRLKNIAAVSTFDGYDLLIRFDDEKYGALIFRKTLKD